VDDIFVMLALNVIASQWVGAKRRPMSEALQESRGRTGLLRRKGSSQ
jgi:hypothetical protein